MSIERYFFWTGNGDPKTTVANWQRSLRRLLELVEIDGHVHMLRDTSAVGWLLKGIPIAKKAVISSWA